MPSKLDFNGVRAVTKLDIERQSPAVKRFFETLTLTGGGSEFDLNGKHVVINVVPEAEQWTAAKDARRHALIDRDVADTITTEERIELDALQEEITAHVEKTAPIPLEYARKLYDELLKKAAAANGQS